MKLLDSSFCADFLRGRTPAKEYRLAYPEESFVLTSIGYYELYQGAVKEGREPGSLMTIFLGWSGSITPARTL